MTIAEFINLISFCILMENGHGILSKAPSYVLEKWETKRPELLDNDNTEKLYQYKAKWIRSIDGLDDSIGY